MGNLQIEPNPDSVVIMRRIDGMSRPMRALVREYGYVIVRDMINEGYTNAKELASLLQTWRECRQEDWLATDYVTAKTVRSIVDAAMYRAAARSSF